MAVGSFAKIKAANKSEMGDKDWDHMSARQFYGWAKEDETLEVDNISSNAKLEPA